MLKIYKLADVHKWGKPKTALNYETCLIETWFFSLFGCLLILIIWLKQSGSNELFKAITKWLSSLYFFSMRYHTHTHLYLDPEHLPSK